MTQQPPLTPGPPTGPTRPSDPADTADTAPGSDASGTDPAPTTPHAELADWRGRRYVVGPTPRDLTGQGRAGILARSAIALAAIGVLQFGYGAAVPTLVAAHDWSVPEALLPFVVWAVLQGGSALPVARLRAAGLLSPGRAVALGGLLCAVALLSVGYGGGLAWLLLGYGVLGGIGAGLVYHSCVHVASQWYPERPGTAAGLVGGAFALGSAPLAAALLGLRPEALATSCAVLAAAAAVLSLWCAARLPSPPPDWWPPETDPRAWALSAQANPAASRDHSPAEAWRSGALPTLNAVLALAGAVSLFDLAVLPALLAEHGPSPGLAGAVIGTLIAANAVGRVSASRWSEAAGRRRVLVLVLLAGALAHAGLVIAGAGGPTVLLLGCAVLAGLGGGACYPLACTLAVDYFGLRDSARNQAFVYSAKALGGLLGVGGGAALLAFAPAHAFDAALAAAGLCAFAAAGLALRLRRPFQVRTIPA
ncbi:MFS transporter [Murinocardiopsis flavida]|uniref:MFS transporter n=1 Tax=Murinocardiopsis flavida TaxID=645275 RepID=A0A2P8CMM5_9ACTN|nr:MFS transporter [Murinocardiopsis flavida]PSK86211.1 MFS transporter [Murinocardiopsis flavida]